MQFISLLSFNLLKLARSFRTVQCSILYGIVQMLPQTVYSTPPPGMVGLLLASPRAACATWRCNMALPAFVLFMCIVWHPVSILYWAILCFMAPQCTHTELPLQPTQQPRQPWQRHIQLRVQRGIPDSRLSALLFPLDYPIETNQLSS